MYVYMRQDKKIKKKIGKHILISTYKLDVINTSMVC